MPIDEDRTDNINEFYHSMAMRQRKPSGPPAIGRCLFCETPLNPGLRWCDAGCRDDWEQEGVFASGGLG